MKKILILLLPIILTGCFNNPVESYKNVADAVANIYSEQKYDKSDFDKKEQTLLNSFFNNLKNSVVDLEKDAEYYYENGGSVDSYGAYVEKNRCYIKYNDIIFDEFPTVGKITVVDCNGRSYRVRDDEIIKYDDIVSSSKYNYRYLGYIENNNEYKFVYRSIYDGSGLVISVNDERIEASFENVDNYELKTVLPKSTSNNIFSIVVIIAGIVAVVYFIKIYNKNHEI